MGVLSMIDLSINLGNILTILAFLAGGIGFVYTMQGRVDAISNRLLLVETELKKMIEVLIQQGRHEERLTAMDARILAQGKRLDDALTRINAIIDARRE